MAIRTTWTLNLIIVYSLFLVPSKLVWIVLYNMERKWVVPSKHPIGERNTMKVNYLAFQQPKNWKTNEKKVVIDFRSLHIISNKMVNDMKKIS